MKTTIQDLELDIELYECDLLLPNISLKAWSETVSKYNAAKIKLCQMKGEQPQVIYYKPEHIINK